MESRDIVLFLMFVSYPVVDRCNVCRQFDLFFVVNMLAIISVGFRESDMYRR